MKTSHVLLASLMGTIGSFSSIGSIAWADSIKPMSFYAEVDYSLLGLSSYGKFSKNIKALGHGDPKADPAEFTLSPENFAYAINSSNPHASTNSSSFEGFRLESMVAHFGPTIEPSRLLLSPENMLLNGHFYACEQADSNIRLLHYRRNETFMDSCIKVNLYLLSKEAADAKKNELLLKKIGSTNTAYGKTEAGKSLPLPSSVSEDLPYLLYVETASVKVAVGYVSIPYDGGRYSVIVHGPNLGDPVAFHIKDDTAIAINTPDDGYLGVYNLDLVFGKHIQPTPLRLDENLKLHNSNFFSCQSFGSFRIISTVRSWPTCVDAELHFEYDNYGNATETGSENKKFHQRLNSVKESAVQVPN